MVILHELASIITDDDILWLVHGRIGEKLLCRPKYLNVRHKPMRLYSPIFRCEPIQTRFPRYDSSGIYAGLYLIEDSNVIEHRVFTDPMPLNCETSQKAHELLKALHNCGLMPNSTGVIGSLLWGKAIDGFSDINLAIQGNQAYLRYLENCCSLPEVHFRSEAQWRSFYHRYCVSGISEDRFVELSRNNFQQGMIRDIPFSIFHIRQELPEYDSMCGNSCTVSLVGEFLSEDASPGYFPIRGQFHTGGQTLTAVIWSRLWAPILPRHAILRITGSVNDKQLIVNSNSAIQVLEVLTDEEISSPCDLD